VIVVDTSAIIAILALELDADFFRDAISDNTGCVISAATFVELSIVGRRFRRAAGLTTYDDFLSHYEIAIHTFDERQARIASDAYRRFGKGNHSAGLNFGDCFAYALAKSLDAPLLFKGADFGATDVRAWAG
jgi:ribonuclease VapC